MTDVRVPKVGMSTLEVEIGQVKVRVGDVVAPPSVICSVMADKVDFDIEAGVDGTVTEVLVSEGDLVAVGTVVARVL